MGIGRAFEKHDVPLREYPEPEELIALSHAIKNYLGRDSALAAVIRAVVDGSPASVGYARRLFWDHWMSVPARRAEQVPPITGHDTPSSSRRFQPAPRSSPRWSVVPR